MEPQQAKEQEVMPQLPDAPEPQKRPFGIYVIIVLQGLNILAMSADLLRVQMGTSTDALPNVDDSRVSAAVTILIVIALVFIMIGLWRYQVWAWFATMIFTGIALILGIWQYFQGGSPYVDLLINSLVVLYLNQRDLRRVFEDQHLQRVNA